MTMTARPPSQAAIRPAAGAVELLLAVSLPVSAAAAVPAVVPAIVIPVLLGGSGLYGRRTGMGVRRSLEAMNLPAAGDAR